MQTNTIPHRRMEQVPVCITGACNLTSSCSLCTRALMSSPFGRATTSLDEVVATIYSGERFTSASSACTDACTCASLCSTSSCLETVLSLWWQYKWRINQHLTLIPFSLHERFCFIECDATLCQNDSRNLIPWQCTSCKEITIGVLPIRFSPLLGASWTDC